MSNTAAKTNYIKTNGLIIKHGSFIGEVVPISSKLKKGMNAGTLRYRLMRKKRLTRIDGIRCSNLAVEKVLKGTVKEKVGSKGTFDAYVGGRWRRLQSLAVYAKQNNTSKQTTCNHIKQGKLNGVKLITDANGKGIVFIEV